MCFPEAGGSSCCFPIKKALFEIKRKVVFGPVRDNLLCVQMKIRHFVCVNIYLYTILHFTINNNLFLY